MTQHTQDPIAVHTGEGEAEAYWWFGSLAEIKATAANTGGQMTIVEITAPPGYEAPLHVHHNEDEAFWILEGDVTIEVGDTSIEAHAGDYAYGPRDIPHRYTVGDAGCRMLFILTPGGLEGLVREMGEPAPQPNRPPALRRGARHGTGRGDRRALRLRAGRRRLTAPTPKPRRRSRSVAKPQLH